MRLPSDDELRKAKDAEAAVAADLARRAKTAASERQGRVDAFNVLVAEYVKRLEDWDVQPRRWSTNRLFSVTWAEGYPLCKTSLGEYLVAIPGRCRIARYEEVRGRFRKPRRAERVETVPGVTLLEYELHTGGSGVPYQTLTLYEGGLSHLADLIANGSYGGLGWLQSELTRNLVDQMPERLNG